MLIKYALQQQIHFNGNKFGNKCCRCNEGTGFYYTAATYSLISNVSINRQRTPRLAYCDIFENEILPMYTQEGVYSVANFITAYVESQ